MYLLYKLAIELVAHKLSKLSGNKRPADTSPHSNVTSYFELARGRLKEMGYELLKRKADINFDSQMFPEVMSSVSLRSLFNTFQSTLPG